MADPFEGVELTPEQRADLDMARRGFHLLNSIIGDDDVREKLNKSNEGKPGFAPLPVTRALAQPFIEPLQAQIDELKTSVPTHVEEIKKTAEEGKAAIDQVISEFKQQRSDETAVADLKKKINAAVKHYHFTDEGERALVEHMKETGTSDPMTAGAYLVQNMERPKPVTETGLAPIEARRNGAPDVDLFKVATGHDDESLKMLHGTPRQQDQWMQNEIDKILAEGIGQDAA